MSRLTAEVSDPHHLRVDLPPRSMITSTSDSALSTIASFSLSLSQSHLPQCNSDGPCDQRQELLLVHVHHRKLFRKALTNKRSSIQPRSATMKVASFIRDSFA